MSKNYNHGPNLCNFEVEHSKWITKWTKGRVNIGMWLFSVSGPLWNSTLPGNLFYDNYNYVVLSIIHNLHVQCKCTSVFKDCVVSKLCDLWSTLLYQTRATVFHRDIQTPRRELKIRCAAEYFWRNSRCLDSRWNTVSSVWYIFSIEANREVKSSKSKLIKTGYQNLLHGCDFLCFSLMNY